MSSHRIRMGRRLRAVAMVASVAVITTTAVAAGAHAAPIRPATAPAGDFKQTAELSASDGTELGQFPESVSGSTAVALANGTSTETAYIFTNGSAGWSQTAELTAPGDDEFDGRIAISGDTIAVNGLDDSTNPNGLLVFIYTFAAGKWSLADTITGPTSDDDFAERLALDGSNLVVNGDGAIYVYNGSGSNWSQTADLSYPAATSLAISGDNFIVGDYPQNEAAIYHLDGGTWSLAKSLTPSNSSPDNYGVGVAIDGTDAAVGEENTSVSTYTDESGSWQAGDILAAPSVTYEDACWFGCYLAMSGTTLIANGVQTDTNNTNNGMVQKNVAVYTGSDGDWTQSQILLAADDEAGNMGQNSLDIDGTTIIAGDGLRNSGAGAIYVFQSGQTIGGTVSGRTCNDDGTCKSSGLGGVTMLLTGTDSDGDAVNATAVTADDGTYSIPVTAGSYQVGPTEDGTTIFDGPSFDPHSIPVTVGTASVFNEDFATCVQQSSATSSQSKMSDTKAILEAAHPNSAASDVSACTSDYTISLKASIHQPVLVDPSEIAHYSTKSSADSSDYRSFNTWIGNFLRSSNVSRQLAKAPEFPECFTDKRVEELTEEKADVSWYSYIKAGVALGGGKLTLSYNQSTGNVEVVSAPALSRGSLTRVYKWKLVEHGKHEETGSCTDKEQVPLVMSPVVKDMDGSDGKVPANGFTILASWEFPWDPAGVKIDPEGSVLQQAIEPISKFNEVIESNKVVNALKEIGVMIASHVALGGVLKKIKSVPALLKVAYAGKISSRIIKGLTAAGEALELLHHAQSGKEAISVIGGLLGIGEHKDDYPVMGAVIRGKFSTTTFPRGPSEQVPIQSTLAMSVASTKFPVIKLSVSRDALANPDFATFTGTLPWHGGGTGNENSSNPFFSKYATGVLTNTAGTNFSSGEGALNQLTSDTKQLPALRESLLDEGVLFGEKFAEEQELAPEPDCSETRGDPVPSSNDTLCWQFRDGRA